MSNSTERDLLYMLHMHTDILVLVAEKMIEFFDLLSKNEVAKALELGEEIMKEIRKADQYKLDIYKHLSKASSTFWAYKMREAFLRVIRSSDYVLEHYGAVIFFARYLPKDVKIPESLASKLSLMASNNYEMAKKYSNGLRSIDTFSKIYEISLEVKRLEEENDYLYREGRIELAKNTELTPEAREVLRGIIESTERFSDAMDAAMDDLVVLSILKGGGEVVRIPRAHRGREGSRGLIELGGTIFRIRRRLHERDVRSEGRGG